MITRTEFFEELLRGTTGRVELRRMKWNARKGKYDMLERYFGRDIAELEAFASNGGGDIFHGVNLRDESGLAKKTNIAEIICAETDVDFKTTPQKQIDEAFAISIFEPTFLLNSGGGYHAYWLLDAALPATEENIRSIESINRGLAQQFGGDYTHDVTRILRTPGRKNSKYADSRMCEILSADGPRYSIDDLKCFASNTGNGASVNDDDDGELPGRFKKLLARHGLIQKTWNGERPDLKDQSRSGHDMAMANLLVSMNFTAEEIAGVLLLMPSGKRQNGSRAYFEKTIGKARKCRTERDETAQQEKVLFEIMENIAAERVDWVWKNKIARGKLTLFEGDPGVGKSLTTLAIAAALSKGEALPGDVAQESPLRSLVISAEDSPSDTIKPRLAGLGADMSQIAVPHREATVSLQVSFLDKILDQWPAAFCVVDPVIAFSAGRDNNKAADVRQLMGPLVDLADRRRCAIVLLRHLNKNTHASAIHRGQGSVDYAAICRSVFSFAFVSERRFMAHTKNSITQRSKTLEFFIEESGYFSWGDESDMTADEILGDSKGRSSEQLEMAKTFLIEALSKGWMASTKLEELAAAKGVSKRTLWRAKTELGIKAKKIQNVWYWTLS